MAVVRITMQPTADHHRLLGGDATVHRNDVARADVPKRDSSDVCYMTRKSEGLPSEAGAPRGHEIVTPQ